MTKYSGTNIDYRDRSVAAIRDPVLAAGGLLAEGFGDDVMLRAAQRLEDACAVLQKAIRDYSEAHSGQAADAARAYLTRLVEPGLLGIAKFRLASNALQNQANYFAAVHSEMTALEARGVAQNPPVRGFGAADPARLQAVRAAEVYQANTNDNLANWFQAFDPPTIERVDVAVAADPAAPAWPGFTGGAPVPGAHPAAVAPSAIDGPAVAPAAGLLPGASTGGGGPDPAGPQSAASADAGQGARALQPLPPAAASVAQASNPGPRRDESGPARPSGPGVQPPSASALPPPLPAASLPPPRPAASLPPIAPRYSADGLPHGAVLRPDVPRSSASGPGRWTEPVPRPGAWSRVEPAPRNEPALRNEVAPRGEPPASAGETRSGSRPPSTLQGTHAPIVPGTGAPGRSGGTHHRPDWLVEDDPESAWLAGLPPHVPAVLRPDAKDGP